MVTDDSVSTGRSGAMREAAADRGDRTEPGQPVGEPLAVLPHVPKHAPDHEADEHEPQDDEADPARVPRDTLPGLAREVPEEDEAGRPDDAPENVVEGERRVRHPRH